MPQRPTLQTERLVLRPFVETDAPDVQRLAGDKDIASPTVHIPHPYEDGVAEKWIAQHQEKFDAGVAVNCAVALPDNGCLVGSVALSGISQDWHSAELGYWIGKPWWGRGYATEAARAMIDYAFDVMNLNRVHAHHMTRNPASGRVMEKLGMKREGILRQCVQKWGAFEDVALWAILREDRQPV